MEKCNLEILPRQSGKTQSLVRKASSLLNEGYSVAFVVQNMPMKRYIVDRYRKEPGSHVIFTVDEYIRYVNERGVRVKPFDYTLIDEYLLINDNQQKELYYYVPMYTKKIVYIKTTAYKLYDKKMIDLIKGWKTLVRNYEEQILASKIEFKNAKEAEHLLYSFLTDPKTQIITVYNDFRKVYNKEQYDLYVMGKIFKEDE
jgi:hypothetical protein